MFIAGFSVSYAAEQHGSPAEHVAGIQSASLATGSTGGNLEGKEQRFGISDSAELGNRDQRRLERLRQLGP